MAPAACEKGQTDSHMLPAPATGAIRSCRRWRRLYTLVAVVTACFTIAAYTFFFSSAVPRTHLERTIRELRALPNDFALESQVVRHAKPDAWTIAETLATIDGLRYEFDKQERQGQMGYLERLAVSFSAGRNALAVANAATYPSCGLSAEDKERYSELRQGGRVFVAINLLQNEELMPTLARQLLALLEELGPGRVFVSIYENASMDLTVMHLRLLCQILDAVGTPYRIIARGLMELQQKEHGHRISRLAHLRNTVLEPLFLVQNSTSESQRNPFETVVFLNDVFFCHGDVLELLLQKKRNRSVQSCGLDFGPRGLVYDRWVLRTMRGAPIYRQKDLVEFFGPPDDIELKPRPTILPEKDDEQDKAALDAGEPFQVFSCWNGMTAFTASVFASPTSLRFRTAHNDPDSKDGATNKASECYLSSVDLWKADLGRVLVVPRARVAYSLDVYNADRASSAYNTTAGSPPLVEWSSTPPSEVVMHGFGLWFAAETKDAWDAA
ncbi:capsular associated protein [Ceratobasidium sp. 395]|nr:capsular associated protein [Ceratobasidium sp. 395]